MEFLTLQSWWTREHYFTCKWVRYNSSKLYDNYNGWHRFGDIKKDNTSIRSQPTKITLYNTLIKRCCYVIQRQSFLCRQMKLWLKSVREIFFVNYIVCCGEFRHRRIIFCVSFTLTSTILDASKLTLTCLTYESLNI